MSSQNGLNMMKAHMLLIESINNSEPEENKDYEEAYFDLPSHWASALINGDYTGYSEEEEEEIKEFLKNNPMAHWITGEVEDLGFKHKNDANDLGGDVYRYRAYKKLDHKDLNEEEDVDYIKKAKEEIAKESDLAKDVAEEHGQSLDTVYFMSWFIDEVAKKLKSEDQLEEDKNLNLGVYHTKYEFLKHIANNFEHYEDNIRRLYPADQHAVHGVFLKFLKNQKLDFEEVDKLSDTLSRKIREVGDAYDEMASFLEMVKRFI